MEAEVLFLLKNKGINVKKSSHAPVKEHFALTQAIISGLSKCSERHEYDKAIGYVQAGQSLKGYYIFTASKETHMAEKKPS